VRFFLENVRGTGTGERKAIPRPFPVSLGPCPDLRMKPRFVRIPPSFPIFNIIGEGLQGIRPHGPDGFQISMHIGKTIRCEVIDVLPPALLQIDQSGFPEYAEVLRDCRLTDGKARAEFDHRLGPMGDALQQFPAGRIRQCRKGQVETSRHYVNPVAPR